MKREYVPCPRCGDRAEEESASNIDGFDDCPDCHGAGGWASTDKPDVIAQCGYYRLLETGTLEEKNLAGEWSVDEHAQSAVLGIVADGFRRVREEIGTMETKLEREFERRIRGMEVLLTERIEAVEDSRVRVEPYRVLESRVSALENDPFVEHGKRQALEERVAAVEKAFVRKVDGDARTTRPLRERVEALEMENKRTLNTHLEHAVKLRRMEESMSALEGTNMVAPEAVSGLQERLEAVENWINRLESRSHRANERLDDMEQLGGDYTSLDGRISTLADRLAAVDRELDRHVEVIDKRVSALEAESASAEAMALTLGGVYGRLEALEARTKEVTEYIDHTSQFNWRSPSALEARWQDEAGGLPAPGQSGPFGDRSDLVSEATRGYIRSELAREIAIWIRAKWGASEFTVADWIEREFGGE